MRSPGAALPDERLVAVVLVSSETLKEPAITDACAVSGDREARRRGDARLAGEGAKADRRGSAMPAGRRRVALDAVADSRLS